MKLNKDKFLVLVLDHKYQNLWVKVGHDKILESAKQQLVRMKILRNRNFDDHAFSLCKKPGKKTSLVNEII